LLLLALASAAAPFASLALAECRLTWLRTACQQPDSGRRQFVPTHGHTAVGWPHATGKKQAGTMMAAAATHGTLRNRFW
jgi:hypothetical protein